MAIANTQSVCINKKTGEIRVSNSCNPSESKGTRKINPPKISKDEKLKKQISDLESQLLSIEAERNKIFDEILKVSPNEDSLDSAIESCQIQSNVQLEKCILLNGGKTGQLASLNRQLMAVTKLLESYRVKAGIYRVITCKNVNETITIIDEKPKCPKGYK